PEAEQRIRALAQLTGALTCGEQRLDAEALGALQQVGRRGPPATDQLTQQLERVAIDLADEDRFEQGDTVLGCPARVHQRPAQSWLAAQQLGHRQDLVSERRSEERRVGKERK